MVQHVVTSWKAIARVPAAGRNGVSRNGARYFFHWQQNYGGSGSGWQMRLTFKGDNQISSSGYPYDAVGNVVMDYQNCYTYEAENRLSSLAPPGGADNALKL
jgi:hypothetical protein